MPFPCKQMITQDKTRDYICPASLADEMICPTCLLHALYCPGLLRLLCNAVLHDYCVSFE